MTAFMHLIKKDSLLKQYTEIIQSFGQQEYFGKVHSLETPSEGSCSYYYIELIPPFPKTKELQLATLWKLSELNYSQSPCQNKDSIIRVDLIKESFHYILDSWKPRQVVEKDILRIKAIMLECKKEVTDHPIKKAWLTHRQPGYYLNHKFQGSNFSTQLASNIINPKNKGMVIYDDWDNLTVLIESKNRLSMFKWETFA